MEKQGIGVVGLGVMGANLALNMESRGFSVGGYDRDEHKSASLVGGETTGRKIVAYGSVASLLAGLERPRKVLVMVPAAAVDAAIAELRDHLDPGDILIDGGNTHFTQTERREKELEGRGVRFVGMGVSGGESGARHGPSLMPGGPREAYDALAPVLRAIAAVADGEPCVAYIGPGGAGHFVKMVHNGIEYGNLQLIAEVYAILTGMLDLGAPELARTFQEWNEGELGSYLVEITAKIFEKKDGSNGGPLVEKILDEAEQKGTGKWTSQVALDLGVPVPTITAAVDARILSALKNERVAAAKFLCGPSTHRRELGLSGGREEVVEELRDSLYASMICAYAQGFALMAAGSGERGWNLDLGEIARIWRGGCIIRARLLDKIRAAYSKSPKLVNLMVDPYFGEVLAVRQTSWRRVVALAKRAGIPTPAIDASLDYFDGYRTERLPANLIQAQRDFFGAHTYRRIDREGAFHTEWEKE